MSLSKNNCAFSSSSLSEDSDNSLADVTYFPGSANDSRDTVYSNDEDNPPYPTAVNSQIYDNCFEEDSPDLELCTPVAKQNSFDLQPSTSTSNINNSPIILASPAMKGKKKRKQPENWKKNIVKKKRNSGEYYVSLKKSFETKEKLNLLAVRAAGINVQINLAKRTEKRYFPHIGLLAILRSRGNLFPNVWNSSSPNTAMCVWVEKELLDNTIMPFFKIFDNSIRVCKLFFKNTLDINDRPIRTVIEKREKLANQVLQPDQRGKHGKHRKLDKNIANGIRAFIETIPKIESHYTRANTSKTFIEGSKTISSLYRDYVDVCKEKKQPFCTYISFYRSFTENFNISFFTPKKDLCEQCEAYTNMTVDEKANNKAVYENHLHEKNLSREEKSKDKERQNAFVAVYDLQAVMQLPKGEVSAFYYKSKVNVFNFTIFDIKRNNCQCFVWDESNGKRGVNELGTCVFEYIKSLAKTDEDEIIFYSDNCAGQQKNKFMVALYLYAVRYLGIKSITHKYLIKGHTQNEGDSAHSLIERATKRILKSGPVYTTDSFITIIRSAKKTGHPFLVQEMSYGDFFDIKLLSNDMGPLNMGEIKLSEVKILKVQRESPNSVLFKTSYAEEKFREATIIKSKKKHSTSIDLQKAYHSKIGIPNNKREDINELIKKNLIPRFYQEFYSNL